MGATYEIWLTDDGGRKLFPLDKYANFSYSRSTSYLGTLQIQFTFKEWNEMVTPFFRPDWRIDIWRSPAYGYRMRREETYLLRKPEVNTRDEDGVDMIMLRGRNGMDLLNRRYVIQYDDTAYTTKTDYIDDMMKAVVREQMLYGSCLDIDGVVDNDRALPQGEFTVQEDASLGPEIKKTFPDMNVLDLMKELQQLSVSKNYKDSDNKKIFFGIVPVELDGTLTTLDEPSARTGFQFQTFADRRGRDRTDGVEFSVDNGNLKAPMYVDNHLEERNAVVVKGTGTGIDRASYELENLNLISRSRWNRCEIVRNASLDDDDEAMKAEANVALGEGRPIIAIDCAFLNSPGSENTPQSLYGIDWDLGDTLPVNYAGKQFEVDVFNVYVSVNDKGVENISGRSEQFGDAE